MSLFHHLAHSALLSLLLTSALASTNPPLTSFTLADNPADIALAGDAAPVATNSSAVALTRPSLGSRGRIIYRSPIRFLGTNPGFSSNFSFAVAPGPGRGIGLSFAIAPRMFPERVVFSIQYAGVSFGNDDQLLNGGGKLYSFIDYDGETKMVTTRLSNTSGPNPSNFVFSYYQKDLPDWLWRDSVLVGLCGWTGNTTRPTTIYSWSFEVKQGSAFLMHSDPVNPQSVLTDPQDNSPLWTSLSYPWGIIKSTLFVVFSRYAAYGVVRYVWSVLYNKYPIAPVEDPVPLKNDRNAKIVVVGEEEGNFAK